MVTLNAVLLRGKARESGETKNPKPQSDECIKTLMACMEWEYDIKTINETMRCLFGKS